MKRLSPKRLRHSCSGPKEPSAMFSNLWQNLRGWRPNVFFCGLSGLSKGSLSICEILTMWRLNCATRKLNWLSCYLTSGNRFCKHQTAIFDRLKAQWHIPNSQSSQVDAAGDWPSNQGFARSAVCHWQLSSRVAVTFFCWSWIYENQTWGM